MYKRSELYNIMISCNSSKELMIICAHLHENTTIIMKYDWIVFSALISENSRISL